jgi:low temperature requirement protein LtrA
VSVPSSSSEHVADTEHRVTPLELFFDLVFVFAFTQVTTLLHEDPTWRGLGRGLLVLTALWWAWASYAWLTNALDANRGPVLAAMLVATGAMFLAALAVPDAFGPDRFLFAVSYVLVLGLFVLLYALAARGIPDLFAAVLRVAPWVTAGGVLILIGAFAGSAARPWLWLLAVVAGFLGPLLTPIDGWRVHPDHFAERHGLIVIIAVGESLVAIGLSARNTALGPAVVGAAVLGLAIAASLWLAYFDFFSVALQQLLVRRQGDDRVRLARDAYSYLHLPMIVGIVFSAFALRDAVARPHATLHTVPAVALCLGSSVYLLGYIGLQLRVTHRLTRGRPIAAVAFAAILPAALHIPALAALAVCAGIWSALHAYELIWWREARAVRRAGGFTEEELSRSRTSAPAGTGSGR